MVARPPIPTAPEARPRRDPGRRTPPVVLLTGFEPFAGTDANPSALACQALHGRQVAGHRIVAACLPTAFDGSVLALDGLLRRHHPVLVIATGLAGGRPTLSVERVAINVDDARIPDNHGAQPVDRPVVPGGPAAWFSTLPVKAIRAAWQAAGLPAEVSQTAGTFVCNHLFYALMHRLATDPALAGSRGGFIHLPWMPGQGLPALGLGEQVRGLYLAVHTALRTTTDHVETAGALA